MIYALIALPARTLVAAATDAAALPNPPADSLVKPLPHWDMVPGPPLVWSPEALDWMVPAPRALLSQREFMGRWRAAGLGAALTLLFTLEVQDSPEGAAAREWLTEFRTARGIDPADPDTVGQTEAVLALAVSRAVVTPAAVTAGRPVILAPL